LTGCFATLWSVSSEEKDLGGLSGGEKRADSSCYAAVTSSFAAVTG
jgi:hypothetical protein